MFTKQILESFNELDYSIYNTVIRNGLRIVHMQIRELAAEAHVSTTSVVRFCKKCGCQGYAEFKLRYQESLQQEQIQTVPQENQNLVAFLEYSTSQEFRCAIDSAIQYLQAATQILVLGVGASGSLARFGAQIFCYAGYFSLYIGDPFLPIFKSMTLNPVVVAVSFSGKTPETLNMAKSFLEAGCKLISITNSGDCPLARISDVNIAYYMPDLPFNGNCNLGSQLPVVYTLERLARLLYSTGSKQRQQQKGACQDGFISL